MINHKMRYFLILLSVFLCNFPFAAYTAERHAITFENSPMRAKLHGQYRGRSIVYSLSAHKGQTLNVEVRTNNENNDVVFSITGPNGISPMGSGETEIASGWSGELSVSGEYHIEIGAIESEVADYELNVSLTP